MKFEIFLRIKSETTNITINTKKLYPNYFILGIHSFEYKVKLQRSQIHEKMGSKFFLFWNLLFSQMERYIIFRLKSETTNITIIQ